MVALKCRCVECSRRRGCEKCSGNDTYLEFSQEALNPHPTATSNHQGIQNSRADVLTLTQDSNFRRPGTPIGTIPIMLKTSTQNNGYNPSKNSSKLPNTSMR